MIFSNHGLLLYFGSFMLVEFLSFQKKIAYAKMFNNVHARTVS